MIDSIDISLEKENDYQALKIFLLHGVIICVTIGNRMNDDLT